MAPVLPGLSDSEEELDATLGALVAAGATSITVVLHLRPGAREWFMAGSPRAIPSWCRATSSCTPAGPTCPPSTAPGSPSVWRRYWRSTGSTGRGAARPRQIASGVPGDEEVGFPAGSLPTGGLPGVRPTGELTPAPAARD